MMDAPNDLTALARSVIDGNVYMTLATADGDGLPWAAPVYFAHAAYAEFLWISSPNATHSRNIAVRPEASIVIFDSRAPVGGARAVYIAARAEQAAGSDFDRALDSYNGRFDDPGAHGVRVLTREELSGPASHRLYRANATDVSVLDPGGTDSRHRVIL